MIEQELEARDYDTEKDVFWVPDIARCDVVREVIRQNLVDLGYAL